MSVTKVYGLAFRDCTSIKSIIIHSTVEEIDGSVFTGWTSEQTIYLELLGKPQSAYHYIYDVDAKLWWGFQWDYVDGVPVIRKEMENALEYSYNVETGQLVVIGIGSNKDEHLIIPETFVGIPVSGISKGAFENCTHLKSIHTHAGINGFDWEALAGCTGLESIVMENESNYIVEDNCVFWKDNYSLKFACPNGLISSKTKRIENTAFIAFGDQAWVIIPKSVDYISAASFKNWTNEQCIFFEAEAPGNWSTGWYNFSEAKVYWGDEWEFVDGIPTPKDLTTALRMNISVRAGLTLFLMAVGYERLLRRPGYVYESE